VSLLIYSLLETPGGLQASTRLVVASVVIAAGALLASELLDRYGRRRLHGTNN
jgi:molybdate transport system permease protein